MNYGMLFEHYIHRMKITLYYLHLNHSGDSVGGVALVEAALVAIGQGQGKVTSEGEKGIENHFYCN